MKGYTLETDAAIFKATYADNAHGQRTAHLDVMKRTANGKDLPESWRITTTNAALDALLQLYAGLTKLQALDTATAGTNVTTLRALANPLNNAVPAALRLTI